jgi:hypothetical protein
MNFVYQSFTNPFYQSTLMLPRGTNLFCFLLEANPKALWASICELFDKDLDSTLACVALAICLQKRLANLLFNYSYRNASIEFLVAALLTI